MSLSHLEKVLIVINNWNSFFLVIFYQDYVTENMIHFTISCDSEVITEFIILQVADF